MYWFDIIWLQLVNCLNIETHNLAASDMDYECCKTQIASVQWNLHSDQLWVIKYFWGKKINIAAAVSEWWSIIIIMYSEANTLLLL